MPEASKPKPHDARDVRTSTRLLFDKILLILGLATFVVGLVGEILGWWNELGVLVSLAGLLAGLYSAVDRNGVLLLEGQSATHGNQERMLENQERMVDNQERMVDNQERTVELLDRIASTLDEGLGPR